MGPFHSGPFSFLLILGKKSESHLCKLVNLFSGMLGLPKMGHIKSATLVEWAMIKTRMQQNSYKDTTSRVDRDCSEVKAAKIAGASGRIALAPMHSKAPEFHLMRMLR